MADRPIIFSAPMVRAILDGRKTQTRRVLTKPVWAQSIGWPQKIMEEMDIDGRLFWFDGISGKRKLLPLHQAGDRLWVRETWGINHYDYIRGAIPKVRPTTARDDQIIYFATEDDAEICNEMPRRPSIYMPRWASRLTLTVMDVRIERAQDISEADAMAEGAEPVLVPPDGGGAPHVEGFRDLWDSIYAARGYGWDANPWVVAVTFSAEQRNIDTDAPDASGQ